MMNKIKTICTLAACSMMMGCTTLMKPKPRDVGNTVWNSLTGGDQNYAILNIIAALASLLAAGSIMARAFGLVIPWRPTIAAISLAVGAWVLRAVLVGYMWLFMLMVVAAAVFGVVALLYSYRHWIESRIGADLDQDGKVGSG